MATDATPPTRASPRAHDPLRRALEALFPEARRRARRRRRLYLSVLAMIAAATVVVVAVAWPPPRPRHSVTSSVTQTTPASVSSTQLPADGFFSITTSGGKLLISGGRMAPLASGTQVDLRNGRVAGACNAVAVDPRTLKLGAIKQANCGDPALYGQHVLPVAYWTVAHPSMSRQVIDVRVARSDPAARDGYTLGPVVTSYAPCSDGQASWLYGDGSLWIYNPLAHPTSSPLHRAVLLRISERTGAVLQRWRMPEIIRALLAADRDGLWLSPSIESGFAGHLLRAQRTPYQSLYRITPGQRAPSRLLATGQDGARWLVAGGTTATIAVGEGHGEESIETITGDRGAVRGPRISAIKFGGELGIPGGPTVAGSPSFGFFTTVPGNHTEMVRTVSAKNGRARTIAHIPSPLVSPIDQPPTTAILGQSFFFISPSRSNDALHRVTPPRAH
jgi:hypothetical protein